MDIRRDRPVSILIGLVVIAFVLGAGAYKWYYRATVDAITCASSPTVEGLYVPQCDTTRGQIFRETNRYRIEHNRKPLTWGGTIGRLAQEHAQHMADEKLLYHNRDLTVQVNNWSFVGENVGVGTDWLSIQRAFYNSPAHRANILDRDYTRIGVGAVFDEERLWVVVIFKRPLVRR